MIILSDTYVDGVLVVLSRSSNIGMYAIILPIDLNKHSFKSNNNLAFTLKVEVM